jgi:hypothetical protein
MYIIEVKDRLRFSQSRRDDRGSERERVGDDGHKAGLMFGGVHIVDVCLTVCKLVCIFHPNPNHAYLCFVLFCTTSAQHFVQFT